MAEYFSHDYGSRNDPKLMRLQMELGHEGKGIYWDLVEVFYEQDGYIDFESIPGIAYGIRCELGKLNKVLNDYGLFANDGSLYWSESIISRLNIRADKSDKARIGANARWGKDDTREKASDCIFYIIKVFNDNEQFIKCGLTTESVSRRYSGKLNGYKYELLFSHQCDHFSCCEMEDNVNANFASYTAKIKFPGYLECFNIKDCDGIIDFAMRGFGLRNAIKGNDIKGNEIKENKLAPLAIEFDAFWNAYDKKTGEKAKLAAKWAKLTDAEREAIMAYIPKYKAAQPDKSFRKNPETFLNNKSWNDEIIPRGAGLMPKPYTEDDSKFDGVTSQNYFTIP